MNIAVRFVATLMVALALLLVSPGCRVAPPGYVATFCNPLDLSYRFSMEPPSRREAADPTLVKFRGRYFLFVSKSGGYWHSDDLATWHFIQTNEIPTEEYAPTAIVIGDTVYFLASSNHKSTIYRSIDPLSGQWEVALDSLQVPVWDPAFFLDSDNRLYLYWGCSDVNPLYGVELDYHNNFRFIGEPVVTISPDPTNLGWEVRGDKNTDFNTPPWLEGSWMLKYDGVYYLKYSAPGTEFKSYADAVYTSTSPLGPFTLQSHNPFAYKPGGFAAGAGHGSSFWDNYGNFWHLGTITISVNHIFERRLGLFPAFIDDDGIMHVNTRFGDYPMKIPGSRVTCIDNIFTGWMLLSYNKPVEASSWVDSLSPAFALDERIRTFWAASEGDPNPWISFDMGEVREVKAIQVNFADYLAHEFGRDGGRYHRYVVEHSVDGIQWGILIDKSRSESYNPHAYHPLEENVRTRYIRVRDIQMSTGRVAMSGIRVFGKGLGQAPGRVNNFTATRDPYNRRSVLLSWDRVPGATGYNVSFGTTKDKLYNHYMVYSGTTLAINSLNARWGYYFSIEAFNESGVGPGGEVVNSR